MGYYGAIHCGYCYQKGHNKVSCEKRKEHMEERRRDDPNNWAVQQYDEEVAARKVRRCKYCAETGHNRRSCVALKESLNKTLSDCSEWRKNALNAINELGLGVGSLVLHDNEPVLVMDFLWGHGSHYAAVDMDNTENYKELFAYTNYHTRPRTPLLLKIKRLNEDRWGQTEVPFPKHPLAAPFSETVLLSAAPKSFAASAPEGWVSDSPPHRVMEKFNPDRW